MKDLKKTFAKSISIVLCVICSMIFVVNTVFVISYAYLKHEFDDLKLDDTTVMTALAEDMAERLFYNLSVETSHDEKLDYFDNKYQKTNFIYEITDNYGNTLTNKGKNDKFAVKLDGSEKLKANFISKLITLDDSRYETDFYFYDTEEVDEYISLLNSFYDDIEYSVENVKVSYEAYITESGEESWYNYKYRTKLTGYDDALEEGETQNIPKSILKKDSNGDKYFEAYKVILKTDFETKNSLIFGWKKSPTVKDNFYFINFVYDNFLAEETSTIVFALVACFIGFLLYAYLVKTAGIKDENGENRLGFFDKIPIEIILTLVAAEVFGFCLMIDSILSDDRYIQLIIAALLAELAIGLLFIIYLSMTISARIKNKAFLKSFIIYRIIAGIFKPFILLHKGIVNAIKKMPLYTVVFPIVALICGSDFFFTLVFSNIDDESDLLLFMFIKLCLLLLVSFIAVQIQKIHIGIDKISNGNLDYKINTKNMVPPFMKSAQQLNEIGKGMDLAIDEKVKSERLKAELITNVSHDIKTPLTSIINYVDILKREGLGSPNASAYLEVIDRQSARLKKLTEDLLEASKANTGNINVTITDIDVNVLLSQAVGEYSERLENSDLEPIMNLSEEDLTVKADGNLLWRIFDNLLSNICKYSKPGTRVYLETGYNNGKVTIIFKNISSQGLNISGDELMERFVRGDSSRNTEGSGLGLSIAKSLAVLQNADFRIDIDGDLFKSVISFDK